MRMNINKLYIIKLHRYSDVHLLVIREEGETYDGIEVM